MVGACLCVPGRSRSCSQAGRLLTKVGNLPVVVFWSEDRAWAIEDRCPHMGFPLHQGTVESGLVTCHWHHARFDLVTGCTLDPFADDARGFQVTIDGDDVLVEPRRGDDPVAHLFQRLDDGLEHGPLPGAGQVGARLARGRDHPRRDRAARHRLRHPLPRQPDGVPASPCSSPWPTCSPSLDARRPRAGARARARVRRPRHPQPPAALPAAPVRRLGGRSSAHGRPARLVVPPLRRDPLGRLGRARAHHRARRTGRDSAMSSA